MSVVALCLLGSAVFPAAANQNQTLAAKRSPASSSFTQYKVIRLSTLPGYVVAYPAAINDSREIVGTAQQTSSTAIPYDQAFSYQDGIINALKPQPPIIPGDAQTILDSSATAISSNGFIVGYALVRTNSVSCPTSAYAVSFAGPRIGVIGCPEGAPTTANGSEAVGVNSSGYSVGYYFSTPQGLFYSYQYQATPAYPGPLNDSNAYKISGLNDEGVAVGQDLSNIAVMYAYKLSSIREIGTLGGSTSFANAIANSGVVVGASNSAFGTQHAFAYSNGKIHDLGTPLGTNFYTTSSDANAVNNLSEIVGGYVTTPGTGGASRFGPGGAFIYSNATMQDLTSLIKSNQGWELQNATGIDDCGDIVGSGTLNGQMSGYLAMPISVSDKSAREKLGCKF